MKYEFISSYSGTSIRDTVCLENDTFVDKKEFPFKKNEITLPVKNRSYTVRNIINTPYGVGIRLEEIRNKKFFFDNIKEMQEPFFGIARFKKIV